MSAGKIYKRFTGNLTTLEALHPDDVLMAQTLSVRDRIFLLVAEEQNGYSLLNYAGLLYRVRPEALQTVTGHGFSFEDSVRVLEREGRNTVYEGSLCDMGWFSRSDSIYYHIRVGVKVLSKRYRAEDLEIIKTDEAAMLQDLLENPDDQASWAVFGDYLQGIDDPRGELIQLDLELSKDPKNRDLKARKKELEYKYSDNWAADIMALPVKFPRRLTITWKFGFIHYLDIFVNGVSEKINHLAGLHLRKILSSRSSLFIKELALQQIGSRNQPQDYQNHDFSNAIFFSPVAKSLRKLSIDSDGFASLSLLYEVLPKLEELKLTGNSFRLGKLEHSFLQKLDLTLYQDGHPFLNVLQSLGEANLPQLRTLRIDCDFHGSNQTDYGNRLKRLFTNTALPRLNCLELSRFIFPASLLEDILSTDLLSRIKELKLEKSGLGQDGAMVVIKNAARFRALDVCSFSMGGVPKHLKKEVKAALKKK